MTFAPFAALSKHHMDQLASAVDITDFQTGDFARPQARSICRGQCNPGVQARDRFKEFDNLVRAEHDWQSPRFTGIGDELGYLSAPEGGPVKETQRADRLVQAALCQPPPREVHLVFSNILHNQLIG